MEEVYIVDGDTANDVRRQLQEAVQDMEEKNKDDVDTMNSITQRQEQQGAGWWRRNRVGVATAPAVGIDLSGFALVINGSSLVSLSLCGFV